MKNKDCKKNLKEKKLNITPLEGVKNGKYFELKNEIVSKICMPYDTRENINKVDEIDNLALYINKYSFLDVKKFKFVYCDEYKINKVLINEIAQNYYKKIEKLKKLNLIEESFELETDERLIIGLGGACVYETSLTLHHIYGVPYIPGSAIKGSFRSYLIEKRFNNNEKDAMDEGWFKKIFGNEENQGKVIFFDAFAVSDLNILPDIMNPHYQDYYSDDKNKVYPTDDQSPVPIPFLVVKGKFKFVFGVKEDFKVENKEVLKFVKEELQNSLKEFGIGAKTAVGYGYFK